MIKFWAKTISSDRNENMIYTLSRRGNKNPWIICIKSILNECGLSYIWENQTFVNTEWLKIEVSQILRDQSTQKLDERICDSSKAVNLGNNYLLVCDLRLLTLI
jgi:hypothetical protein